MTSSFTGDAVVIVEVSQLCHIVRSMSFQRFLAGVAAILLLLPTACADDAQAPVVDNLGTVLSPSNSLIREPENSSVNGTLKSTYEYLRLIDGHDLPDDDGYAHDHLVAALRPYLVNGGDSRQARHQYGVLPPILMTGLRHGWPKARRIPLRAEPLAGCTGCGREP